MKGVLDVSAAYRIITGLDNFNIFLPFLEEAELILAPQLFYSEAANTAWKYFKHKKLDYLQTQNLFQDSTALVDFFIPDESYILNALELSTQFDHPVYDCIYLTLASKTNSNLITADKKMLKLADKLEIKTIHPY